MSKTATTKTSNKKNLPPLEGYYITSVLVRCSGDTYHARIGKRTCSCTAGADAAARNCVIKFYGEAVAQTLERNKAEDRDGVMAYRFDPKGPNLPAVESGAMEKNERTEHQGGEARPGDSAEPQIVTIPLDQIDGDHALQMRVEMDWEHVDDLIAALDDGRDVPPVDLFVDSERSDYYWLGDGWHRVLAARQGKIGQIKARIHTGGKEAALKHALGANAAHGLRRTNKDKRKAVLKAVEMFPKLSARGIADLCKVGKSFAANMLNEVSTVDTCRVGKDGKTYSMPTKSETQQIDFWQLLAADFEPITTGVQRVCKSPLLVDESVPLEERLKGVRSMRDALKRADQDLRDIEDALSAQEKEAR